MRFDRLHIATNDRPGQGTISSCSLRLPDCRRSQPEQGSTDPWGRPAPEQSQGQRKLHNDEIRGVNAGSMIQNFLFFRKDSKLPAERFDDSPRHRECSSGSLKREHDTRKPAEITRGTHGTRKGKDGMKRKGRIAAARQGSENVAGEEP